MPTKEEHGGGAGRQTETKQTKTRGKQSKAIRGIKTGGQKIRRKPKKKKLEFKKNSSRSFWMEGNQEDKATKATWNNLKQGKTKQKRAELKL